MARFHNIFTVEVLTPATPPYRQEAQSVVFPAPDGQVGVLAGRAPLVAVVGSGKLEIRDADNRQRFFYVSGGFAQVREEGVTILAEEFTPVEQLDPEQLWADLEQAKALPADTDQAWRAKDEAVRAARAKFNLAQEHRRRTRSA